MIETIDLIIRSIAAGILIAGLLALSKQRLAMRKRIAAINLTVINILFFLVASVGFKALIGTSEVWLLLHTFVLALYPVLAVWGFLELLDDTFRVRPWHFVVAFLCILFYALDYLGYPGPNRMIVPLFCWVYFITVAIRSNRTEFRTIPRYLKVWFIGGLGFFAIILLGQAAGYGVLSIPDSHTLLQATILLFAVMTFALFTLSITDGTMVLREERNSPAIAVPKGFSPAEISLLRQLTTAMEEGAWKEEGLTIGKLAKNLKTPEHRLRKVINGGLGHRNFAEYLNSYRIEEAQKLLSDPERADTPIVNIAFELGYASLGPFNRAFRDVVGNTPSDFRKHHLSRQD